MISRLLAIAILPLLTGAAPAGGLTGMRPDAALIDKGDLGVATYAMLFVIVALLVDRWLDRRALGRLADAIDRASKAEGERHTAMLVQLATLTAMFNRQLPSPPPASAGSSGGD